MSKPSSKKTAEKKALKDSLILMVSLVLSEPFITPRQGREIGRLIGQLKKLV